jgi:hypothetical protein
MKLLRDQESGCDIVKALQPTRQGRGAGLTVALATEEASKFSRQARDLTHVGGVKGSGRSGLDLYT